MAHEDRTIACAACATQFVWKAGEQEFFAQHGFMHAPRKCKGCRESGARADHRVKGRPAPAHDEMIGSPPARLGAAKRRPAREGVAVEAPCSVCGALALLPFQPDGVRPVYCRRCFQSRRTHPNPRT